MQCFSGSRIVSLLAICCKRLCRFLEFWNLYSRNFFVDEQFVPSTESNGGRYDDKAEM